MTDPIKSALDPTGACPDVEALAEVAQNPEIQRHVEGCAHCRTELALLQAFESAEPSREEAESVKWIQTELRRKMQAGALPTRSPSAGKRFAAWLGRALGPGRYRAFAMAAASLLVLAGTSVLLRRSTTIQAPGDSNGVVWRSGQFSAISPSGEIARGPAEFKWEAVPGAATYQVQLQEVDRTVIWTGDSSGTIIPIPPDIRVQLKPGRAFQWQVIARNTAGEKIASTDLQSFHIAITP